MNEIALRAASSGIPGSRTPPYSLDAEKSALGGVLILVGAITATLAGQPMTPPEPPV